MLRWVYESKNVTLVPDVAVRLPDTADLLPNELARRVAVRCPLRRGEPAAGPAGRRPRRAGAAAAPRRTAQSASLAVDVYADRATGLPLQVQLFAKGRARRRR